MRFSETAERFSRAMEIAATIALKLKDVRELYFTYHEVTGQDTALSLADVARQRIPVNDPHGAHVAWIDTGAECEVYTAASANALDIIKPAIEALPPTTLRGRTVVAPDGKINAFLTSTAG